MTDINYQLNSHPVPVSQLPLWQMQKDYFINRGVDAWRQQEVPNYITSNPFIAYTYAELVLAYIQDYRSNHSLHPNEEEQTPLHIIELGTGCGKFSFHFLTEFFARYDEAQRAQLPVRYVMTDISRANIEFWQQHPQFSPYVEAGVLDFALFDSCTDVELTLTVAQQKLSAKTVNHPLVAIANYVFDSIPHDVFSLHAGQLAAGLATLTMDGQHTAHTPQDWIEHSWINYHLQSCDVNYYADKRWNHLLANYQQQLPSGSAFLMPVGAFQTIDNLLQLSRNRLLILSTDKGHQHPMELAYAQHPQHSKHGSFSFTVNYHAIIEYAKLGKAQTFTTPDRTSGIEVLGFSFSQNQLPVDCLRQAYQHRVIDFGPDDFFIVKKAVEQMKNPVALGRLLRLLELSRWDNAILQICYDALRSHLSDASAWEQQQTQQAIDKLKECYFELNQEDHPAIQWGILLTIVHEYAKALECFELAAIKSSNESDELLLAIASCHYATGNITQAEKYVSRALLINENADAAIILTNKLSMMQHHMKEPHGFLNKLEHLRALPCYPFLQQCMPQSNALHLQPLQVNHLDFIKTHLTTDTIAQAYLPCQYNEYSIHHWFYQTLTDLNQYPFVIFDQQNQPVGMVSIQITGHNEGYFYLWITKQSRRKGYAINTTFQTLVFALGELGLSSLSMRVLKDNTPALNLMKKFQLEAADEDQHFYYYTFSS